MRIDSHQHFWKLSRGDYNWLTPDFGILYQDYLPNDLLEDLKKHQIDKTILVQAADSIEETYYMFELMESHPFIAGVVGWLDFEADDFTEQLKRMMKVAGFVSVRPMLQDIEDDNWVLREKVVNNIKVLHEWQIPLDILIYPRHLKVIKQLLEMIPNLKCVIDHLAKPQIKEKQFDTWSKEIATIASFPNVYCKISGVITEADHKHWSAEDCRQYILHCINVFTEDRIMFGSDWPVCLLAGSYSEVYDTADIVIKDMLDENGWKKFYGKNAEDFYSRIRRDS
ncbi:amidohydrolase family protein [Pseudogracilibacillus auburnensis]|uniref:amidohydrolase family protein n=1 Tax=Pseudogracilibacillus auburnensis TaxID=1494959 RepID=UPI001A96B5AD|nr:amidohydrolase family protein [Pseudogracilibacillus auburnensis]MBO1002320.1 amidohydrolase family protein [Pseudogracilibacillus auburnensis]